MKLKTFLIIVIVVAFGFNVYSQNETVIHSVPLYWSFELSSNHLASAHGIKNYHAPYYPTASGSIYLNWNLPLTKTKSIPITGFSISPGIGIGASTISINKDLQENCGVIIINDIEGPYEYNYIQGIYLDIPIDFRYLTTPNDKRQNFVFELGLKLGKLLYTEKEIQVKENVDLYTHKTRNIGILNKFRYGINSKIGYRKLKINKNNDAMGMAFSTVVNYYFSDVFIDQADIYSKSFSIGASVSFIFK